MALNVKYLYVVMMDVEPDKEDLFNKTLRRGTHPHSDKSPWSH